MNSFPRFGKRTFIFQNQQTYASITIQSESQSPIQSSTSETVNVQEVFQRFLKMSATQGYHHIYRAYHPQLGVYIQIPVLTPQTIPSHFFLTPIIMIKYTAQLKKVQSDLESIPSSAASSETKRERNKERTIREVIQLVKQWREIHNSASESSSNPSKINLQDAAKKVGVSKKSLDDYYCQLRLGEQYNFDFQSNLDQKVGVLRTFVKKTRPKADKNKPEKHPKRLKIIEQLREDLGNYKQLSSTAMEEEDEAEKANILQQNRDEVNELAPASSDYYEMQFFNSFDVTLNDPDDPFIAFQERDFRKKDSDFESSIMPW